MSRYDDGGQIPSGLSIITNRSGATETLERPVTVEKKTPPPPLMHLVCICQRNLQGKGQAKARCGCNVVSGRGIPASQCPAPELCVVCHQLTTAHVPCPLCKRQV